MHLDIIGLSAEAVDKSSRSDETKRNMCFQNRYRCSRKRTNICQTVSKFLAKCLKLLRKAPRTQCALSDHLWKCFTLTALRGRCASSVSCRCASGIAHGRVLKRLLHCFAYDRQRKFILDEFEVIPRNITWLHVITCCIAITECWLMMINSD